MAKTHLSFHGYVNTDNAKEVFKLVEKFISTGKEAGILNFTFGANSSHEEFNATLHGASAGAGGGSGDGRGRMGRRTEAGERAAADFADEGQAEGGQAGGDESGSDTGSPAAGGKRRGRPPGSGKAGSGTTAGKRSDDGSGSASGGAAQGTARNEPVGTGQGAGQGAEQGQGGRGGAGGGGDDKRGSREAARISTGADRGEAGDDWDGDSGTSDEDWNDAAPDAPKADDKPADYYAAVSAGNFWPDDLMPEGDLTKETLGELLAEHFNATGGKDREPTFALMSEVTGERSIKNIDPKDFDKLARALLKDAAKYRYGIKKPK